MKKLLLVSLLGAVMLSACGDKPEAPQEPAKSEATQATPQQNEQPKTDAAPMEAHDNHDGHDHDEHDGHDHTGHDHAHSTGKAFQCGDKVVTIDVQEHEGEPEAHLTVDNITYDLEADVQAQGRFTSDDAISELGVSDDKGVALVIEENTAKLTTLDGAAIVECTAKTT